MQPSSQLAYLWGQTDIRDLLMKPSLQRILTGCLFILTVALASCNTHMPAPDYTAMLSQGQQLDKASEKEDDAEKMRYSIELPLAKRKLIISW